MVDVCVALDLLLPLLSNTIYETGATSVTELTNRVCETLPNMSEAQKLLLVGRIL
jgi:hypothetical protein